MIASRWVPWTEDDANWGVLQTALLGWIGTPYRHMMMVRGRGADCTLFIGAVLVETGIMRRVTYDYYAKDWYNQATDDELTTKLHAHFKRECWPGIKIEQLPPTATLRRGDMLGFSTRRPDITNHLGVLVRPRTMIHCIEGRGVTLYEYGDCWSRRLKHIFRIFKEVP